MNFGLAGGQTHAPCPSFTLPPVHTTGRGAAGRQFGGVPISPGGQAARGAGLQFGGVPISPGGQAARGAGLQFGGVPIWPGGHVGATAA